MQDQQLPVVPEEQMDAVEMIDFGFVLRQTAIKAKKDGGGVNFKDWPKLMDLIQPGADAIEGAENIIPNFLNASPADRQPIVDYFAAKYNLSANVAGRRVQKAATLALGVYALFTDDDADDNTRDEATQTLNPNA